MGLESEMLRKRRELASRWMKYAFRWVIGVERSCFWLLRAAMATSLFVFDFMPCAPWDSFS